MCAGIADRDGSAVFKAEARKRTHYTLLGQVSFDERSYKLTTVAVESSSFGRLGKEGSDQNDQVAASIVEGTDAASLARKASVKNTFHK